MVTDILQVGTATMSLATLVLVLRLVFDAGKIVQKVEYLETRVTRLENHHEHSGAD